MAQPNVNVVLSKRMKKKKNMNQPTTNTFWKQINQVPPAIIIHNTAPVRPPTQVPASEPLVELVNDNSPQVPGSSTNPPITNIPTNPTPTINTKKAENEAKQKAANIAKQKAANIAKQKFANIAKQNAAIIAKQKAAFLAMQRAANMTEQKPAVNVPNATVTANPDGNPENTNIQVPLNQPNVSTNPAKKNKWQKFQAGMLPLNNAYIEIKKQKKLQEMKTKAGTNNTPVFETNKPPVIGGVTQGTSQVSTPPVENPKPVEFPKTTTSTAGITQGFSIPTLHNSAHTMNINIKTKQSLQQEMVRQRMNWIKPEHNVTTIVPSTSGAPQEADQTTPANTPQIVEAPNVESVPAPGLAIPTLEDRNNSQAKPVNQRSNAGSFFKTQQQRKPKPSDIFAYLKYSKGIPRSFLVPQLSNEPGSQQITADSPIWPASNMAHEANKATMYQPTAAMPAMDPASAPIFVQTENPVDVQQQYSPSDIYSEQGNNLEPCEDSESSEISQGAQKRLSAFQRLGPLSQPKKPKLTINLNLNKEQPVREVVNDSDDDTDRYTPVHLRQDIIMSTDPTVMNYLTVWPWRKNVGIRKSATARNSRSVMILEQEQMEEAYEKNKNFIQITVKGYPSTWTKERVLDAVLDSVKGYSFIPCFTEFYQHECKFLVLRCRSALVILHKTGFYIHKDGVELAITISLTHLTLNQIDFIPRLILRKRMAMGYVDTKLNLSAFTLQDDISHFIYFPLSRISNQSEFVQLQSVITWEHLTDLDLSHNRLTTISGFDLHNVTPRLKHLNLSHNFLEKITELINYRKLPLKKIHLEGNPLCHDYIDPDHYVKVLRMMFPAIVEIDGVPVHRKGELPQYKQNYCPEEAKGIAEKFLETFFPLLDSGSDNRSLIQEMYEDNATLTVTYCYKLRYGQIYKCFRNLFLYARFLDEGECDSVVGAMAITKLINRWPQTEHDPYTFTVDVLYHTESTTILRIGGILKLTAETLAEDEHLLTFTRTVVLYSEDGEEYKIQNEMVYWDEPSAANARSAFRINTISQNKINLKIESTTDEDLREKFLDIFMKLTTMDKKISERCLEMNNWNFKLALEHFTKLLKINNLDSLTQEVTVAADAKE